MERFLIGSAAGAGRKVSRIAGMTGESERRSHLCALTRRQFDPRSNGPPAFCRAGWSRILWSRSITSSVNWARRGQGGHPCGSARHARTPASPATGAIRDMKREGELWRLIRHRRGQLLNSMVVQDHRRIQAPNRAAARFSELSHRSPSPTGTTGRTATGRCCALLAQDRRL